jgi:hypothetical protein
MKHKSSIAVVLMGLLIAGTVSCQVAGIGEDAALGRAVRKGDLIQVRQCLQNGADINARDSYGYTALIGASYFGNEAVVRLLLENGADPNAKDDNGRTALNYARAMSYYTIVWLLKAWGARDEGLYIYVNGVRGDQCISR